MKSKLTKVARSTSKVVTREELRTAIDESTDLTREEELVLRMRYGITLADDEPLGMMDLGAEARSRMDDVEAQVLAELRERDAVSEKQLIVAQLKARPSRD